MSIVKWSISVVVVLGLSSTGHVARAEGQPLTEDERLELEIYRKASPNGLSVSVPGYQQYLENYYRQRTEIGDAAVSALRWQLAASYVLLALMVTLVLAGIGLSSYQLWVAAQLALSVGQRDVDPDGQSPRAGLGAESVLEVSKEKIRLQTSFVGLFILLISAGLLVLFVHEVYKLTTISGVSPVVAAPLEPKQEAPLAAR